MDRHKLRPFELLWCIRKGLQPYSQASSQPYRFLSTEPIKDDVFSILSYVERKRAQNFDINRDQTLSRVEDLLPYISECLFRQKDVEKFKKEHPELLEEDKTKPLSSGKKELQESVSLKKEKIIKDPVLMEPLKEAKPEIKYLFNELQEYPGFQYNNNPDREKKLKEEAEKLLDNPENKFDYLKKEYFNDQKIYSTDPKQTPRDFIGALLKKIVKDQKKKTIGGQLLYEIYKEI